MIGSVAMLVRAELPISAGSSPSASVEVGSA